MPDDGWREFASWQMEMLCHDDRAHQVDQDGRVLIPARRRWELGVAPGDAVILEIQEGELRLRPYKKTIEDAQAIIRKYIPDRTRSLFDELIEQRRREAARE